MRVGCRIAIITTLVCCDREHDSDKPQKPDYLVEHCWYGNFTDTVDGIEWFIDARELKDSVVLNWDLVSSRILSARAKDENSDYDKLCPGYRALMTEDAKGKLFVWSSRGSMPTRCCHTLQYLSRTNPNI